jgi:hypothetical protein
VATFALPPAIASKRPRTSPRTSLLDVDHVRLPQASRHRRPPYFGDYRFVDLWIMAHFWLLPD